MAQRPTTRASIAVGGSLLCCLAASLFGAGRAEALSLPSVSSVGVSLPSVGVSLPGVSSVGVSLPSVGVSIPSVGVSLPGVSVSTPEVKVSTPEVKASSTEVNVSTTEVSVTTPEASAPTQGQSSTGSTETSNSSGTSTGSSGGASGGSPSGPPSATGTQHGSTTATAASVDAGAGASSTPTSQANAAGQSATGGGHAHPSASRSSRTSQRHHDPAGGSAASTVHSAAAVPAVALAGHSNGAGAAKHRSSDPLEAIGRHIPLPLPVPNWSKPIILILLLLALWFAVRSRVAGRRARRLEGQQATLLRDVDAMQAALVPAIPERVGGLAVSVAYRPAEGPAAGGDFYDVFTPERGKIAIILGDVAGHGHRALTQAALTRYTLRAYLQAGLEPRAALALAGRVLADRRVEHFATVLVAVYHTAEARLTFASAGHPHPILHGLHTREPVDVCASPPIGWSVPTGRRQTTVSLPPGTVACFFSDGLIEARCKGTDLLGRERLEDILAALGPRPDADRLLARVSAAALATPDDMAACIVVPEMTGIADPVHVEELEVDAEALERGQARRFLETCQVLSTGIEQALKRAGDIAAAFGTAVLRVELGATTATATVTAPAAAPQAGVSDRRSRPGGGQGV